MSNELYASQSPSDETEEITRINAGIVEMVDAQIAMIPSTQDNNCVFHKTGGTVTLIGLALVAVGFILYSVAEYNYGAGETLLYIGAGLLVIVALDVWGQQ